MRWTTVVLALASACATGEGDNGPLGLSFAPGEDDDRDDGAATKGGASLGDDGDGSSTGDVDLGETTDALDDGETTSATDDGPDALDSSDCADGAECPSGMQCMEFAGDLFRCV